MRQQHLLVKYLDQMFILLAVAAEPGSVLPGQEALAEAVTVGLEHQGQVQREA